MKCDFCGREVDAWLTECPYCHYRFKVEPKVLSPAERDTFDGVTIDETGAESQSSGREEGSHVEYEENYREYESRQQNVPPQFKVRTFGCSSGILMTLLILGGILALFFFLLPAFLVFAAIGAVVVFLIRLFS